jgi:hypothetical protein
MIVQLTNERNTTLNWKDSGNSRYRRRYCIMIIIIVIIDVTMLGLVFINILRSLRYSLIISWNVSFVITDEQEQKRPDDRIRVCVRVHE